MKYLSHVKHFGIWGFGKVGKAAIAYLYAQGYQIGIMDKRKPTPQEQTYLQEKNIAWYSEDKQESFFYSHEFIIPSPGINISAACYATHRNKWLTELDFFNTAFTKPIVAITGSIGKTSTTHILNQLFKIVSIPIATGGNIGIPTFDLINQQNTVDYALLEVSSFQLNYCKNFAPTLAIWTNFHPNHLDHHGSEHNYFLAKETLLAHQTKDQFSLIPFALRNKVAPPINGHKRSYFVINCPTVNALDQLQHNEQIYYIDQNRVIRYRDHLHTPLMILTDALRNFSFLDNILLLVATCDVLGINSQTLNTIAINSSLPEHRIEKVGCINNIDFYNDSKSTTAASTIAAVEKLHNHPLHLFLGGLSKGVDRTSCIMALKTKVKHIYCFGKEADILYKTCIANQISATFFATLTQAFSACALAIKPGDRVLLSPSGSSYDLYENYEQRGKHFKELVMLFIQNNNRN